MNSGGSGSFDGERFDKDSAYQVVALKQQVVKYQEEISALTKTITDLKGKLVQAEESSLK